MKNKNKKLIETLQSQLTTVNKLWEENKSQAYIVGYLQGVIKQTIEELER